MIVEAPVAGLHRKTAATQGEQMCRRHGRNIPNRSWRRQCARMVVVASRGDVAFMRFAERDSPMTGRASVVTSIQAAVRRHAAIPEAVRGQNVPYFRRGVM